MQVTLIRHGKTAGNLSGRYVGRSDVPLCEEGIADAERCKTDPEKRTVFVSPLLRARMTASILFPNAAQRVIEDLKEMDFGAFEGRTAKEMEHDPVYRKWVDDLCEGACPGGESQAGFRKRVVAAFSEALKEADGDATFVVHGGVIMAVMAELSEPKREFYAYQVQNLCGYSADVAWKNGAPALLNARPFTPAYTDGGTRLLFRKDMV